MISRRDRLGRFLLLYGVGHLTSLAGFELSRVWAFFPAPFQPLTVMAVVAALAFALLLTVLEPGDRPAAPTALTVWVSITAFPLIYQWRAQTGALIVSSFILSLACLRGWKVGIAILAVCTLAALRLAAPFEPWAGSLVLILCSILETRSTLRAMTNRVLLAKAEERARDQTPTAEISWKGFARLYAVSERGEGEKFSRKVLADTVAIIESCGGLLTSGSEHRGVYQFPSTPALEQCRESLAAYGTQVEEVLSSVNAPTISLVFNRRRA